MSKKSLPRGLKKYICRVKARLRREYSDVKERERLIYELYKNLGVEKNKKH